MPEFKPDISCTGDATCRIAKHSNREDGLVARQKRTFMAVHMATGVSEEQDGDTGVRARVLLLPRAHARVHSAV
eukprot:6203926-Pleurochrysis_carterae.AAC.3